MFILKNALDNIKFHKKRTTFSILLIAIASSAILLYSGFIKYSEEGMALGFIYNSGHIQVRVKDFWNSKNDKNSVLTSKNLNELTQIFNKMHAVKNFDSVLNFQGIIESKKKSAIFLGTGYDNPHTLGAADGEPVFDGENTLVIGNVLFNTLGLNLEDDNNVNLTASYGTKKIISGSFKVSGNIETGTPETDSFFLIAARKDMLKFFNMEDTASYIRLYLKNNDDADKVKNELDLYFKKNNLNFEAKTWKELNPSWKQVSDLFNVQFQVVSGILCILIFVALTQSLSASFMERIGEFGTMEAIGVKKSALILSLILEVCILVLIGILAGVLLSHLGNFITNTFDIKMNPPGSTNYYLLNFYITAASVWKTQSFIFFTGIISIVYPIYTIRKHSSIKLINYNTK